MESATEEPSRFDRIDERTVCRIVATLYGIVWSAPRQQTALHKKQLRPADRCPYLPPPLEGVVGLRCHTNVCLTNTFFDRQSGHFVNS